MGSEQQFCLRWNNHNANMMTVFDHLLQSESLVDVTLSCEGCSLRAHKVVLSACSPYFQAIFTENPCKHPVVILKEVNISELRALIDFMYKGEVNVSQEHLTSLLKTAEYLKIKGLSEVTQGRSGVTGSRETIVETHRADVDMVVAVDRHPPISGFGPLSPGGKRKRMRHRTSDSVSSGSPNGTRSENDCSSSLVLDMKGSPEVLESQVDLPHHGGIVDVGGMTDHYLDHDHQRMDDEDDVDVEVDRNDGDNQSPTGDDRRCQPRSPLDSKEKIVTLPPPPPLVDQNDIIPPRLPVLELAPPPYAHHHHHHQQLHHRHPPSPTQNLLLVPPTSTSGVAVPSTSAAHVQHAQGMGLPPRLSRRALAYAPQRCRICQKVISNIYNFRKHMKVHSPVKQRFECHLCLRFYNREDNLRWHLRTKHGVQLRRKPRRPPATVVVSGNDNGGQISPTGDPASFAT